MKAEEYLKERDINPNRVIKKTKQKSGHGIALKDLLEEFASQSEPKEEPTAEGWISDEEKEDRETARRYIDSRITQMREQFIIDVFQEHSHHSIFDHNLMDEPGFKAAVKDLGLTDKQ